MESSKITEQLTEKDSIFGDWEAIFGNELLCNIIASYLNFGDLKCCSLVSRKFGACFFTTGNFSKRCLIKLDRNNLVRDQFGASTDAWKNVSVNFTNLISDESLANFDWMVDHLRDVEYLKLYRHRDTGQPHVSADLYNLLNTMRCLKHLSVDPSLLHHCGHRSAPDIPHGLASLESLTLLGKAVNILVFDYGCLQWERNYLAGVKNIRHLKLHCIADAIVETDVFRLLSASAERLETLILQDFTYGFFGAFGHQIVDFGLPRLTLIGFALLSKQAVAILPLMDRLPSLSSISIKFSCELDATDAIQALFRVLSSKRNLIKHLKLEFQSTDKAFTLDNTNWSILSTLHRLQRFSLRVLVTGIELGLVVNIQNIVDQLPQSIESVTFQDGVNKLGYGTRIADNKQLTKLNALNPKLLTVLELSKAGLGDEAMIFICRNFQRLRRLRVTREVDVTDRSCIFDFLDDPESNIRDSSLKNLKGLQFLELSHCPGLTDLTIIHGITFMELQVLDITGLKVTAGAIELALAQNPSLEILRSDVSMTKSERQVLINQFPRIRNIGNERLVLDQAPPFF